MVPVEMCNAAILLTSLDGVIYRMASETKEDAGLLQRLRRALRGHMLPLVGGMCEYTKKTVMVGGEDLFIYYEPVFQKIRHS